MLTADTITDEQIRKLRSELYHWLLLAHLQA